MTISAVLHIDAFLNHLLAQDRAEKTITGYYRDLAAFATWYEQITGQAPDPTAVMPRDIRRYRQVSSDN